MVVGTGLHTVSETAGTGASLTNYASVISGDCAADGTITLAAGQNAVCTITNTLTQSPTPTPIATPVCPTPTPRFTPTSTPTVTEPPDDDNQGNDDNQGVLQIKAPGAVLSKVCEENDTLFVKVRNFSDSAELVGVYLDVVPPGGPSNPGGCQPGGRMLQTTVVLGAAGTDGQQVNVFADNTGSGTVMFSCGNPNAVAGLSYTFVAVVDAHADDLAACGPGALLSVSCYNAPCDDVAVCSDFRLSTNGATVRK